MPVAAPRCDQPGARFEDHAVFGAVVRGEHFSEALNGTVGLVAAEGGKGRAGALKSADGLERVIDVVTVEDWLADILEAQAVETGALEEARGGFGIAERERVRTRRGWLCRFTERAIDRLRPFVVLAPLPDEQHQSRAGSHGCGDVRDAAAGSAKNIVPKRLITTSNAPGAN
jgi:hypothetical protein